MSKYIWIIGQIGHFYKLIAAEAMIGKLNMSDSEIIL